MSRKYIILQAFKFLKAGGFLIAIMMSKASGYWKFCKDRIGDFYKISLNPKRVKQYNTLINFKDKGELEELFKPFEKFLVGFYTLSILPDEVRSDHWLYIEKKNHK